MGITGLIPFLEKASTKVNIKSLKGNTFAIDTYCFLHKGAFSCAEKLAKKEPTFAHILYCLKYVNMLLQNGIKPILVFDGRHLPAKQETELKRRESRQAARKRAGELLRLGKIEEARSYLRRCVDITHEMALQLIKECRKINVDCIVAPYEADAQLAFLNINGIAQYVITEDSDLVLFGCTKIIFKLDLCGNGLLVQSNKLYLTMGTNEGNFKFEKFRHMCILSGCDYLDSLPGIGLAKACKFILKTDENDAKIFLRKIPSYLNMRHLEVSDDYINNFLKADATFQHMLVYNPLIRKLIPLTNPSETNQQWCCNAGSMLDDKTSFQLALGNIDPFTLKILDDWNPDDIDRKFKKKSLKSENHSSIWETKFKPYSPQTTLLLEPKILKFFQYKQCEKSTTAEVKSISDTDLFLKYMEPPTKRQCLLQSSSEENTTNNFKRNPFVKHNSLEEIESPTKTNNKISLLNQISPLKKNEFHHSPKISPNLKKISKFNRTTVNSDQKIVSKFFKSPLKSESDCSEKIKLNNNNNNNDDCDIFNESNDESNLTLSGNSLKENDVEVEDINHTIVNIESAPRISEQIIQDIVSNFSSNKKTEKPTVKSRRIGLSKPKSTNSSGVQTRLSQFGFQKKPQLKTVGVINVD